MFEWVVAIYNLKNEVWLQKNIDLEMNFQNSTTGHKNFDGRGIFHYENTIFFMH